jgi:cytochrome c peroxidase
MRRVLGRRKGLLAAFLALIVTACGAESETPEAPEAKPWLSVPADFPPLPSPADNELTEERAALGKRLFFDKRLSSTEEVACASCHLQSAAFSDPRRFSVGVEGRTGARNAPALVNAAWGKSFFWDGGVPSLELQAIGPIQNELEMNMTLDAVAERLNADSNLVQAFEAAYGEGPSEFTVPRAVASFVRTLVSGDSPYDRYRRGDPSALSPAAERGLAIFTGERGECFHCHADFNLTIDEFRNNGIAEDDPDRGRALITQSELDVGRFKVPTLRNVAVSAPYMHDGALETLEDVVEQYAAGGRGHWNTDPVVKIGLELEPDEKQDLVRFLESLTDPGFLEDPRFAAPAD